MSAVITKDKYKVTNWSEYNKNLKERYNINVWVDADLAKDWYAKKENSIQRKKGKPQDYGNASILFCLSIKYVFKMPYRGCRGFVKGYLQKIGLYLKVPCFSQICKRSEVLGFDKIIATKKKITDISIDSTGLKVHGEGEWKVRKHGASKRRTWMKLHIGTDIETQETVSVLLTTNSIDDGDCVADILTQTEKTGRTINSYRGDGAYDKEKVRKQLYDKKIVQIIPQQTNAIKDKKNREHLEERDEAIARIKQIERKEWKKEIGYHKRSLSETNMFRFKTTFGSNLSSRTTKNQQTEVTVKCYILNKHINLAKPKSCKVA
jgi:Transposase DDE domain